jgi:MYXO-CTERM domain-containing protein
MYKPTVRLFRVAVAALAVLGMAALTTPQARAGVVVGVDVQNYIVLYQGGSSGSQLSINNFGTTGIWRGDIGIAGTGQLAASGPGTVQGNINFAAPNTGQASISNTTVTGTVNYGVTSVQTIMTNLNTLSAALGVQAPTGTAVAINTSSTQTILASSGANEGTYRLFSVTSVSTNNGQNLIIQGDGSQSVVFDVGFSSQFQGNILLEDLSGKFFGDAGYAGLTPDQVLFNVYGSGNTLQVNNNGNAANPNNIITADFLDPNGPISMVNTRITGRVFGGDSTNMQIVSGDTITLPPSGTQPVPAPPSVVLMGLGAAGLAGFGFWSRRRQLALA